jgi:hypothetical protein
LAALAGGILQPTDFLILGSPLPEKERKSLVQLGWQGTLPATVVAPPHWEPWSRVLVLQEEETALERFLGFAVEFCRALGVKPVLLTVASSTRQANRRQEAALELLGDSGRDCEFDLIVGAETGAAAAHVARWRHCQGIIAPRQPPPPWWRRWQNTTLETIMNLAHSFAFVSLPGNGQLFASPTRSRTAGLGLEPLSRPLVQ